MDTDQKEGNMTEQTTTDESAIAWYVNKYFADRPESARAEMIAAIRSCAQQDQKDGRLGA